MYLEILTMCLTMLTWFLIILTIGQKMVADEVTFD